MRTGGSSRRSRRPQLALAGRIARRLYDRLGAVEWLPSDESDVFRLTFSSGLEPRYLKLPLPGTDVADVVHREVLMLPALRAHGFPVLEFEHSTDDLAAAGTAFHVTREVEPAEPIAVAARFLASPKRERFVYQSTLEAITTLLGVPKPESDEVRPR